jgi:hypothetical protein
MYSVCFLVTHFILVKINADKFAPTIPSRLEDPRKAPSSSVKQTTSSSSSATTPSKLMNRFKKKSQPDSLGELSQRNIGGNESTSSVTNTFNIVSEVNSFQEETPGVSEAALTVVKEELLQVKAERDELLLEKSFWLSKFQSDNAKLLQILISTREVKTKMLQEIDSLEKEKDRLRSLQMDGLDSSLLDRVLDNSPLAEANRTTLPAHLRGRADELHKTVNTLATKCRANQLEVFEMVVSKVEDIETHFLNRNDDAVDNAIHELKNIASSSPGNVLAAVNVSKKYPEMMLAALIEKRDDAIRDESLRTHGGAEMSGGISGEATEVKVTDDVTKTLMAQNNTLRASVAQLRKKTTELKGKLSVSEEAASEARAALEHHSQSLAMEQRGGQDAAAGGSGSGSGGGGGGGGGSTPGGSGAKQRPKRGSLMVPGAGATTALHSPPLHQEANTDTDTAGGVSFADDSNNSISDEHVHFAENVVPNSQFTPSSSSQSLSNIQAKSEQNHYVEAPMNTREAPVSPRKRVSLAAGRKTVTSVSPLDNSFDALPDFVKDLAWGPIVAGIGSIAVLNPLAGTISRSVLQGVQTEVAYQTRESVAPALWMLGGRDRWGSAALLSREEAQSDYKELISQTVNKCLSAPQGNIIRSTSACIFTALSLQHCSTLPNFMYLTLLHVCVCISMCVCVCVVNAELVSLVMLALTYTHSRSANIRQQAAPLSPLPPPPNTHRENNYESEDDDDDNDDEENAGKEERGTFDDHQFGDSSVLFQSPSQFSGRAQQHQEQFTLNPDGNARGNPRYMAS